MGYKPIRDYGVIGDRRTAALVGRDGSIDWLCLPDFDGPSVFGALLDDAKGGRFRIGPVGEELGQLRYLGDTNVLQTSFGPLRVTDVMAGPGSRSSTDEATRVIVRRATAVGGQAQCEVSVAPVYNYGREPASVELVEGGAIFRGPGPTLSLATSVPVAIQGNEARAEFTLQPGEVRWVVLAEATAGGSPVEWPIRRAEEAFADAERYWRDWTGKVSYRGPFRSSMIRCALLVHLLSYAPKGSLVAAPTTSLPEIIGGPKNWDYRYAWVRDASLSIATLALLGPIDDARAYMDWLVSLSPDENTGAPLKVMYGIRGETDLDERTLDHLDGYMGSRPVRIGNRAHRQFQLDAFGILADCVEIYLKQGGHWEESYWDLMRRVADFVADNWQRPGHDIWELGQAEHWVNSKMLCWVALDRAIRIARRIGKLDSIDRWDCEMAAIHREVMDRGWSARENSFVQRYGADNLDSAVLLGPVLGFLPVSHPRVLGTVVRLREQLGDHGMLRRFRAEATPDGGPPGEGAFNPCTLWLITTLAMAGWANEAEYLLDEVSRVAEPLGLMPEEADPVTGEMMGNFPLLFSQIELVRAGLWLPQATLGRKARTMGIMAWQKGMDLAEEGMERLGEWLRARR